MEQPEQLPTIDDLILALPLKEKVPVIALKQLHDKRLDLDQQQEQLISQVKQKYAEQIRPLLARASQLIQGGDPTQQQIQLLPQYLKAGEKTPQLKGKIIDSYWNSALENSRVSAFITENDEKALENLVDIQLADVGDNPLGINLRFVFKANAYFTQGKILRRVRVIEGDVVGIEGDTLAWKDGKWLTHEAKKVKNKKTGETSVIKGKKVESFFNLFENWSYADSPKETLRCEEIMKGLMDVVQDSLRYFLGLYEQEVDSEQDEYEVEDDEEEEPQSKKK